MEHGYADAKADRVAWTADANSEPLAAASVLIVEDDPDIREMVVTLLEIAGFHTHACASAEAALRALREEAFDLVLTDYALPERTGLWLLESAESEGLLEGIPALIVTAHPLIEGAKQYEIVQKPFDMDDLVERVRQRMDTARPRRRARSTRSKPLEVQKGDGTGDPGCPDPVELILYVSTHSPQSAAAVRHIKQAMARFNSSRVKLTVRHLTNDPASAADDRVVLTPALVRRRPSPRTYILGHFSSPDLLLELLADCDLGES